MPSRTRAHHHADTHKNSADPGTAGSRTPLEQALIECSELKLLLFKTFATLSTYASGYADGGTQARKTLDMLHNRMSIGGAHDHGHDDGLPEADAPKRRAS